MSNTTSQRLDAARKELRELRQYVRDLHEVADYLDPTYIAYLAELVREMTTPTRHGESLGVTVTGSHDEEPGPRRSSKAAEALTKERKEQHLRAEKAWQQRRGERGLGARGVESGELSRIIYGKDKHWKAAASSTSTSATG